MRMGYCPLNSHLTLKMHVKIDSSCECGMNIETPKHFFLHCPLYAGPGRNIMVNRISNITYCNINAILFGKSDLTFEENKKNFKFVHRFIKNSGRFY